MIVCPACAHKEILGAVFCSECGSQLIFPEGAPTATIHTSGLGKRTSSRLSTGPHNSQKPVPTASTDVPVSLNILSTGDILPLNISDEITLGRVSEGQPIVPDLDLTPYKAYEAGVSRMHACLHLEGQSLTVTDLGSANGTRINGRQITSHIPYPINHGDILTLGKFKIQVLLRNS